MLSSEKFEEGTIGTRDNNDCCLQKNAEQNSQSDFGQLIEFESDTADNMQEMRNFSLNRSQHIMQSY